MNNSSITLGIIGGSGLYAMEQMEVIETRVIETPFGAPSDELICGRINGTLCAFLPRHGPSDRSRAKPTGCVGLVCHASLTTMLAVGNCWKTV